MNRFHKSRGRLRYLRVLLPALLFCVMLLLLLEGLSSVSSAAAREEAAALLREKCAGRPTLLATHDQQAIQALGWPVLELAKLCD